jgi:hypothetical protein
VNPLRAGRGVAQWALAGTRDARPSRGRRALLGPALDFGCPLVAAGFVAELAMGSA